MGNNDRRNAFRNRIVNEVFLVVFCYLVYFHFHFSVCNDSAEAGVLAQTWLLKASIFLYEVRSGYHT